MKVFVSGCFDLFHTGHVAFLAEAASYGDVYVAVGSDSTIERIKGKSPLYKESERVLLVSSCKYVKEAFISRGSGLMDFEQEFMEIKPDMFMVNEDGDSDEKRKLCSSINCLYFVRKRVPFDGLIPRSSTGIKSYGIGMPYRIDLCGGWLDQPEISKICSGPVITLSVCSNNFQEKCGMATSTRKRAIDLWGDRDFARTEKEAKLLFEHDNPPGTKCFSGAQDSIGIVMPGLNYSYFNGLFWPDDIIKCIDSDILDWLENHIYLIYTHTREEYFNVYENSKFDFDNIKRLSDVSKCCFQSIIDKDLELFGNCVTDGYISQIKMFPSMISKKSDYVYNELVKKYGKSIKGRKLTGAGGGGYWIVISEIPIKEGLSIKVRR